MTDNILVESTRVALWHDLVRDAETKAERRLDEALESYLVFTLIRLTEDASLAGRIMALDLLEGLGRFGAQRAADLRDVGDRCLLLAGLYPEQARRRAVSLDYFCGLGASAYSAVSSAGQASVRGLYQQLAYAFRALVRVLIEVRKLSGWAGLDALSKLELMRQGDGVDQAEAAREWPGAIVLSRAGRA